YVEVLERIPLRTPEDAVKAQLAALGARVEEREMSGKGTPLHELDVTAARWHVTMYCDRKTSIQSIYLYATSGWTDADTRLAVARLDRRFGKPAVEDTIHLA